MTKEKLYVDMALIDCYNDVIDIDTAIDFMEEYL